MQLGMPASTFHADKKSSLVDIERLGHAGKGDPDHLVPKSDRALFTNAVVQSVSAQDTIKSAGCAFCAMSSRSPHCNSVMPSLEETLKENSTLGVIMET